MCCIVRELRVSNDVLDHSSRTPNRSLQLFLYASRQLFKIQSCSVYMLDEIVLI